MKILHLYYDLMNLYGEYGNIKCLKKHMQDQGFDVKVDKVSIGDKFEIDNYDFIYCGSGLESSLKVALEDLKKHRNELIRAIDNNKHILFTGNAMELLGDSIDCAEGLKIVPIKTKTGDKRYTGDVVMFNKEFGEVVGFINKSTTIYEDKEHYLFTYVFKDANLNDGSEKEGYMINKLIGTHVIGPILVKNPRLMRFYVEDIAKTLNKNFVYKDIDYPYEEDSYNVTLNALKQRKI